MTTQPNQGQPPAAVNPLRDVNIVGGSIASSTTAKSTAAPPTYVEGADSPISQDLSGNLRISGSFSASFAESTFNASASVSSATTIITKANTVGYYSAWVQIEGIGTSTVVCEVNNSGTWVPVTVENVGSSGPLSSITTNGIYRVPTGALGFRVRVSVYDGSATVACNLWMRAFPVSTPVGGVPVTQSGTWTVGISAAQTIAVTNTGTFATQAAQSGAWNITNVSGTVSLPTGAATETTLAAVNTKLGNPLAVTGTFWQATQPISGTVTANLGTIAGVSTAAKQPALGTAGAASTDVLTIQGIASMVALKVDGSAVTQPVSGTFWQATQPVSLAATVATKEVRSSTGTRTSVSGAASSTTILASNANRLGASVYNDSTAILYLDLSGGTASAANYTVQMGQNAYYEVPANYTGLITGIWASATGAAKVLELT